MVCKGALGTSSEHWNAVLGVLMVITAIGLVAGNVILLTVLFKKKILNFSSYKLLQIFALTTLFRGLIHDPLAIVQFFTHKSLINNCLLNAARNNLGYMIGGSGFFLVVFMSLDASFRLVYLEKYHLSERKIYLAAGGIYLINAGTPLLLMFIKDDKVFSAVIMSLGLINQLIFVSCFVGIFAALKIHTRLSSSKTLTAHREYLAGKNVLILVFMTLITVSPNLLFHWFNFFKTLDPDSLIVLNSVAYVVGSTPFAMSPFIYLKRDREIRKTLRSIMNNTFGRSQKEGGIARASSRNYKELVIMSDVSSI